VLGGSFPQLDLFTNVPGGPRNPPVTPPPPNPAAPFADWTALVRQQYVDLLLLDPTPDRVAPWVSKLQTGATTPVDLIAFFLTSPTPTAEVHPILRAHRACLGRTPSRSELEAQVATLRTEGLRAVCQSIVTGSAFRARNGTMDDATFVRWAYLVVLGVGAPSSRVTYWRARLASHATSRGALLAHFLMDSRAVARFRPEVLAGFLYVGMLHRAPTASMFARRVSHLRAGRPLRTLVAEFFGTSEYAQRFP
jgi:hypothetical protein